MSFPRYESYKDSGVEWLGEVPEHWNTAPLKRLISAQSGTDNKSEIGETPLYGANGVIGFSELVSQKNGAILVGRVGSAGSITLVEEPCAVSDNALVIKQIIESERIYLFYLLSSLNLTADISKNAQPLITASNLLCKIITYPSRVVDQQTIAAFLDRETAKIDELIAEQQRLVELLKEKRQAVISHAITKGLYLDAPMKDSGIEWLGEVPAHWKICALKRIAKKITDGAHISPETENGIYEFVSTKDVRDDGIDFEGCLRTSEASYEYLVRTGCKPFPGDVLFSKDGTIGRTVVVRENRDFVVASSLIIIKPDNEAITPDFLNYLCQSSVIVGQVESFVKGAGLPRLSIQNLLKIVGIFPPVTEQKIIVDHLNLALGQMASLLSSALEAITLLQERRNALISAAVTGKIDVRTLIDSPSNSSPT